MPPDYISLIHAHGSHANTPPQATYAQPLTVRAGQFTNRTDHILFVFVESDYAYACLEHLAAWGIRVHFTVLSGTIH